MQKGETLFYAILLLIPIVGTWIYLKIVENKKIKEKKSDSLGEDDIGSAQREDQNNCHSVVHENKNLSRRKISSMEDTASSCSHPHGNRFGVTSQGDGMGADRVKCVEEDASLCRSEGENARDNLSSGNFKKEPELLTERCGEVTTGEEVIKVEEAPTGKFRTGGSPIGEGSLERICHYNERDKSEVGGGEEGKKSLGRGSDSTMESLPGVSYVKTEKGDQTGDGDKAKEGESDQVNTNEGEPDQVNTNDNDKRESCPWDNEEKANGTFAKRPSNITKREDIKEELSKEDMNGYARNYYSDNYISKDDYENSSSHLSSSVDDDDSEEISSNEGDSDRSDDSAGRKSSSVLSEDYEEEEEDSEMDDHDEDNDDDEDDDGECADDQDGGGGQSIEEIKDQGNELFKKGDYTQAIFYYNKALKKCKEKSTKSILYSNRAACYSHLENWNQVVEDCNKSINYNENFVKSYIRRSNAYEQLEKYNDASNDLNKAITLDSSLLARYEMKQKKLKYLAEQQLNKEKEEMVGKLKDFGNLLLGKVGLSLDNFEVQKNPNNDGSFNIQFKQNK
ncbi:hypothetical protein, conserved in Apicomplexan species [Plasmodium knowlesi strain H]|uniref:Uncharacterized protein n=3 Tax=Plasmodium knowlesi TaxID=5850 RepID=A0A5K1ULS7_PLAKH|nr:uncharacterized protein PKNH_1461200 [Plasmodium knowlesi strain H]OTN63675.1 Uncharacterized protein PKNOH_S140279900 [Plasmodium knowlesi]CAA9991209.1 tetratricopeptide repeat protein, putative [Plasmodium knowlesi strain H]SBO26271.1 hypothetical protein, conserved in Apicomplexan species [Plasmodium knowlesi strain H]SBO29590.1 hypothetical protein, conserved in Apicomplexan species [Plasmodium knowlesi strain H]VVS80683.1 tetratricopeptide repeat protein, putative [Plasmodium knowlesi |eukprot:XP_002262492.1 [Plasmodium knowlesi strain H]